MAVGGRSLFQRRKDNPTIGDLGSILAAYRPRLERFLRPRCGLEADAEIADVMQEVWLRASNVDFETLLDPVSYLFRIAHNLVLERERASVRSRRRDSDWGYVNGTDAFGIEPAIAERTLLARERLAMVEAALQTVGERAARAFRRYRIDGIDQRSIATELNVSLSTVEKDLRRAYAAVLTVGELPDGE